MREVFNAIRGNAICFPERLAIVLPDEQITYSELWKKVSIAWTKIQNLDLDREKPIILLIDNPIRHITVRFALMCAGYSVAAIRREQINLVKCLDADHLFSDQEIINNKKLNLIMIDDQWLKGSLSEINFHENLTSRRVGVIMFTSGSTGVPKPIAKSFIVLEEIVRSSFLRSLPINRSLLFYGLSSAGFQFALTSLSSGILLLFSPLKNITNFIKKNRVQEIQGSPSQISQLLDICEKEKFIFPLKYVLGGSAPVSLDFYSRVRKFFRCDFVHIYSASEANFIAVCKGALTEQRARRGNCFYPMAIVEVVDESGVPLPRGSVGRIKVTSRRISKPYTGVIEVNGDDPHSSSFLSNDLGRIESDGVLILLGRADETINFGGAKFAPEIPEEIFRKHPLISDAGVVAVRSENSEQKVFLALVTPNGIDLNLLGQWYAQNTSGELGSIRFDQCFLVDQIPRGFNGKILRQQLRDKLTAMREQLKKC